MNVSGGNYLTANVFITGNHIRNFNRRGVKIKFNSAVVSNNIFYNTWTSTDITDSNVVGQLGSGASAKPAWDPQAVVDMDRGEKHIISGNKFINTEYFAQIKIQTSGDELVDNIVIKDNVFTRIGSLTSSGFTDLQGSLKTVGNLIYIKPSQTNPNDKGTNITVKDNSFDVPGYLNTCIQVNRAENVIVADNTGLISSGATGVSLVSVDNSINNNNNFLTPNGHVADGGALSELDNVNITNPTTGQVLKYDGTSWINNTDLQ